MNILVDTPVWSLGLRRRRTDLNPRERSTVHALEELIRDGRAQMIGVIRQELLSGIREEERFRKLRDLLRAFEEPQLAVEDYEEAAFMSNRCRTKGVAGSPTDYLICAVSHRRSWPVFTLDHDFERYSRILSLKLYAPD